MTEIKRQIEIKNEARLAAARQARENQMLAAALAGGHRGGTYMGGAHEDEEEAEEDIIEEERVLLSNLPIRCNIAYKCMTPHKFKNKFVELLEEKDIETDKYVLASKQWSWTIRLENSVVKVELVDPKEPGIIAINFTKVWGSYKDAEEFFENVSNIE